MKKIRNITKSQFIGHQISDLESVDHRNKSILENALIYLLDILYLLVISVSALIINLNQNTKKKNRPNCFYWKPRTIKWTIYVTGNFYLYVCLNLFIYYQGRIIKIDVEEGAQENTKTAWILTALAAEFQELTVWKGREVIYHGTLER